MHTHDDRAVKVLNSLIETTMDSAHGYRNAAEGADNPQFKTMFTERAGKREELCRRLQQEVRSFGGEPEDDQSLMGRIHKQVRGDARRPHGPRRQWASSTRSSAARDVIKAKFEKAAQDADLPEPARQLVATALDGGQGRPRTPSAG
ncbi:MAG: PA2169 family four-helix-bundle protein [Brevundimonas sp.]|nr:PA2169 family four-helix-bundle protein [Brevundimonas sp.]